MSQTKIADYLGVNKSTVSRELKQNSKNTLKGETYDTRFAQRLTDKRRELKPRRKGMTYEIERRIRCPLKREGPGTNMRRLQKRELNMLSHGAIYLWIYQRKRKGEDLLRLSEKKTEKTPKSLLDEGSEGNHKGQNAH